MIYITKENEMLDEICWRYYGHSSGEVELVLESNTGLAEYDSFLPAGLKIKLPVIHKTSQESITRILEE